MATIPQHEGYQVIYGTTTGAYPERVATWIEYTIGEQFNNGNKVSRILTVHFYGALKDGYTNGTSHENGLNTTFSVNGIAGADTATNGKVDYRDPAIYNSYGWAEVEIRCDPIGGVVNVPVKGTAIVNGVVAVTGGTIDTTIPVEFSAATYTITQGHYCGGQWFKTTTDTVLMGSTFTPYAVTPPTGYKVDGSTYNYYSADYTHLGSGTIGLNSFTVTGNNMVEVYYPAKSYTVTYHGNGGLYNGNATWSEQVTYGQEYIAWDNFFTHEGHTFITWTENQDGTGADWRDFIKPNGSYWTWSYDHDITLYAQWEINTFYFNLNILMPDGSEPWQTGDAGSVEMSINGGEWQRLYNEPQTSEDSSLNSYYPYGTIFQFKNFISGTGLHLLSVSGATDSDGIWTAVMGDANLDVIFQTAYNNYSLAVQGYIDGNLENGILGYGMFDVYVNGEEYQLDCDDEFTVSLPYGSFYEIKNIRAEKTTVYNGVLAGNLSGTIDEDKIIILQFSTKVITTDLNIKVKVKEQAKQGIKGVIRKYNQNKKIIRFYTKVNGIWNSK